MYLLCSNCVKDGAVTGSEQDRQLDKAVEFYICSSVHRNSRLKKSNKVQQYADIYLLLNYSTCFGLPQT